MGVAALALAACGGSAVRSAATTAATPGATAGRTSAGLAPTPAAPEAVVRDLSDAQLAGQRIVYSYSGRTPPASLLSRVSRGEAAGVVFFASNMPDRAVLRAAVSELVAANRRSPVSAPLLLMTDQEGGQVRRLAGAPAQSERQIGESADPVAGARAAGRGAASNLASVGLNVNLAPVLDVYREAGGFIDRYERSYGRDPRRVGELGAAFISVQQSAGVAATAKHFPGLGAAARSQNTDERPVVLEQSLHALRTIDEAPYRAAVAARVKLVMLSWAVYPALDPGLPAGFSPTVVQGELRRRMGFQGITITDSLGAGALARFGGPARRALLAAKAGDALMLCSARRPEEDTPAIGAAAQRGISAGIAAREIPRAQAERVVAAIVRLRRGL